MTDLEAAVEALNANGQDVSGESARYGYCTWRVTIGGHDCSVQISGDGEWAAMDVPLAALPSLLNPLTAEMVEQAVRETLTARGLRGAAVDVQAHEVVERLRKMTATR